MIVFCTITPLVGNLDTNKTRTVKISLAEHSHVVLVLIKGYQRNKIPVPVGWGICFMVHCRRKLWGVGEVEDGEGQSFYSKTHSHSATCNELVLVVSKKSVNITDIR